MPYPAVDANFPPTHSARFTSFAAQIILAGESTTSSAPDRIRHLPCQVSVEVTVAAQHLDYIDAAGVVVAMTFPAVGHFTIRMAPSSFETTSTVAAATVFWNSR